MRKIVKSSYRPASLNKLGVVEIVQGIRERWFTASEVLESCLQRVDERDAVVRAWTSVARNEARTLACNVDAGCLLAGVPFGVKDVLDTADLPTEMGAPSYSGHRPRFDAGVIAQLRLAGAIMVGKTATAEFAGTHPAETVNPLDPMRTPGGSSSGSAAAVADFMVPFALGTQTGGSVLRPAAFCGVVGFKPSFGAYTSAGMKPAAPSFDTIGIIARSVRDVTIIHSTLMNDATSAGTKSPLRIGLFKSHLWPEVSDDARAVVTKTASLLSAGGAIVEEIEAPAGFEEINEYRAVINAYERARALASEWERAADTMSSTMRGVCERGFAISGEQYFRARQIVDDFRLSSAAILGGYSAFITPTTLGEAPAGLANTGDPRLQELWTMLHLPSITIPAGKGPAGLPIGVQLVGHRYGDAALLLIAEWASEVISSAA